MTREVAIRFVIGVAIAGCSPSAPDLDPRTKPSPVWNDGYTHRLVIKFGDDARARMDGSGKFDVATGEQDLVGEILDRHALAVQPMLRLGDAKLDALDGLSSGSSDLRGFFVGDASDDRAGQLAAASDLLGLYAVDYVYLEPLDVEPPGDIDPVTELFEAQQTYRGPEGIDAVFAASVGATGAGVRLSDVEYGWTYAHEDLVDKNLNPEMGQTIAPDTIARGWEQHGTAVVGETSAVPNGYGMTGLVPDADVVTVSE